MKILIFVIFSAFSYINVLILGFENEGEKACEVIDFCILVKKSAYDARNTQIGLIPNFLGNVVSHSFSFLMNYTISFKCC